MAERGTNIGPATFMQTIIADLEAPRLHLTFTSSFIEFKKRTQLYDKHFDERNKNSGAPIYPASLKASIDDSVFGGFLAAGWI